MRSVGGAGLVIVGFLFLYLAITGRLDCFFTFVSCVSGGAVGTPSTSTGSTGSTGSNGGINWGQVINQGINVLGNWQNGGTSSATNAPGNAQHL